MLLFAVPAFADSCLFSAAPPFQLSSDAVEWTMQIASGTTCTRGLKLGSTNIKDVKLIAPPQSGKVDIQGPSFSYTAKADFQGQDEFTVQVSGTVVRIAGVSDVKVLSRRWIACDTRATPRKAMARPSRCRNTPLHHPALPLPPEVRRI
jgi:hypothetical protein